MTNFEGTTKYQSNWPWWRFILMVLNIVALVLSVILSWHFLNGGSMPGCNGGSSCDQVLNSKWSSIAGVPVSSFAMGIYLAMMVANLFIGPDADLQIQSLSWKVLLIMAGSIAGSAIWFIIVQKWFIGEFCPYCMTLHITGLLLSALIIWRAKTVLQKKQNNNAAESQAIIQSISTIRKKRLHPMRITGLILIGLLVSVILAAAQLTFTPRSVYYSGKSGNKLNDINYATAPIIGSPHAPYVVKLLFDYECPHCQQVHFMLREAVRRYEGKLAFVLCPTPLNTQCNPYVSRDAEAFKNSCELARIGLKVWTVKHEAYTEFENWMFTYESGDKWQPRSIEAARAKAIELVGEKFNDTDHNDWVENYMQTCVQIYGQTIQNGKGGIPKLVYGSQWVIPEPNNEDEFIMILQKSLAVPIFKKNLPPYRR